MPRPAAPAAAVRLPFGGDHAAASRAGRRALHQQRVGRFGAVEHLEREARCIRAELALDLRAVEELQRLGEAIAAAAHLVDVDPEFVEPAQRVPDRAARHPERRREVLSGTELAVGEQAQGPEG